VKCIDANTGKDTWSHSYEVPPIHHVGWGELGEGPMIQKGVVAVSFGFLAACGDPAQAAQTRNEKTVAARPPSPHARAASPGHPRTGSRERRAFAILPNR
jgi:hypothetical protein